MTAVDFLVKGLPMIYWEDPYYSDLLEQAKEIEKQQIIDAWHNGYNNQYPMIDKQNCGQTYYNETFSR